jgi:hypothetical protein
MTCRDIPHRQFRKPLRAIGKAIIGDDIAPLLDDLCRRIKHIRLKTQAGTYVLVDDGGSVYVLRAQAPANDKIVKREAARLVGLYANEQRPTFPDLERLRTDVVSAFFRVGFLTPAMIYAAAASEP